VLRNPPTFYRCLQIKKLEIGIHGARENSSCLDDMQHVDFN
jgi:hypothetical protein